MQANHEYMNDLPEHEFPTMFDDRNLFSHWNFNIEPIVAWKSDVWNLIMLRTKFEQVKLDLHWFYLTWKNIWFTHLCYEQFENLLF